MERVSWSALNETHFLAVVIRSKEPHLHINWSYGSIDQKSYERASRLIQWKRKNYANVGPTSNPASWLVQQRWSFKTLSTKKKGARGGRRIRGSKRCSNERKKKRKTAGRVTWPRGSQWQGGKWGAAVCVTSGSSRHCVHRSVGRHRNLIHHCVAFFRLFFILWRWWPFSFSFSYPKCFFLGFFFPNFFFGRSWGGSVSLDVSAIHSFVVVVVVVVDVVVGPPRRTVPLALVDFSFYFYVVFFLVEHESLDWYCCYYRVL